MKKLLVASAVALAMAASAHAETNKEGEKWVAGFVEYYSTDQAETGAPFYIDNGMGLGVEFGFRFKPQWAARIEAAALDIDATPDDYSGSRFGIDALYFLPDDLFYILGGLKTTKIAESDYYVDLGIGKHWDINENLKVVTEITAYQNLDTSHTHMGYKLGLAYSFGETSSSTPASARDSDNDGVNDSNDLCANTPYGTKVDATGCAIAAVQAADSDNDGVADDKDKCANTPTTDKVDANGCSIFTEEEVSVDLRVLFSNNSAEVNYPLDPQIKEFADFMKRFPSTDTVIEGHASAPGKADYNMKLSEDRAKAVRSLFIDRYGIDAKRLTVKGFGETQLLDTSNTPAAHEVNRRITAKVSASTRVKVKK
ncbi:OmpA family protein [Paraglaciecola aquimarina]|uniref:OmpA family protein n=1 Tax=Paraglaciecola aquimarina TaxID=1235557 RepID=A0ABU3ST48_9ALTE|nr:OmpA family protein [Paraglaciecola aquimarina]MDU0353142.1 OmpA family protein [Paraglaciecola aquimarina]